MDDNQLGAYCNRCLWCGDPVELGWKVCGVGCHLLFAKSRGYSTIGSMLKASPKPSTLVDGSEEPLYLALAQANLLNRVCATPVPLGGFEHHVQLVTGHAQRFKPRHLPQHLPRQHPRGGL